MTPNIMITFFILCASGCTIFSDPQKLEKIGEDVASDAVQILEDVQQPAKPEKASEKHASP